MTEPRKPMNQRIEEALGPEPLLTPEVLAKLKADGVITHQEYRLFTDGFNEPSNFTTDDKPLAPQCPACKSARVLPIVFGMPGPELEARVARGEVVLGGCMCWGDERDPKWACLDCDTHIARDGTSMGGFE